MQPPPNDYVKQYGPAGSSGPPPFGAPMHGGAIDPGAASSCGSRSTVWGVILIVVGALACLMGILAMASGGSIAAQSQLRDLPPAAAFLMGLLYVGIGVANILIGVFYTRAGGALRGAASAGDAGQVNDGLRAMSSALLVQIVIFFVLLVIIGAAFVYMLTSYSAMRGGHF